MYPYHRDNNGKNVALTDTRHLRLPLLPIAKGFVCSGKIPTLKCKKHKSGRPD